MAARRRFQWGIDNRGLTSLVAETGEQAAKNLVSEMEGGRSVDNFDPLMGAHNAIPPAVRPGPAMAREALAEAAPTAQDFGAQVVQLAKAAGWSVIRPGAGSDNGAPHLLFVREDRIVAAWVTSVPLGWQVSEWSARLRKAGVQTVTWSPGDGLGPVEDVVGRRPGVDRCGQPDPERLDP